MMRQGGNSAVRFTTYSTLKQFVQGTARPGQNLPSSITFGIGAVAGLVTVYTTMPLESVILPSFCVVANSIRCITASSKHACNPFPHEISIATPSTVHIVSSPRKVFCDSGLGQHRDWHV